MSKSMAAMPAVKFTGDDIMSGQFPALQARMAVEHGPVYKWVIRDGDDAGEYVFMVGPEANRFVLHTRRQAFSHALGWSPLLGPSFGQGLLNMDDPEHAVHRKMWTPAFTGAFMEAYLPVIHRVIVERTRLWPGRGEVDVYAEARTITFEAAAAALAGFEPGPAVDRLGGLFYTLLHGFESAGDDWEALITRMLNAQTELDAALRARIAARRDAPPDEQPRDVLGVIAGARDAAGAPLSEDQVLAHLNILLVAGHETTTSLGAWVLYLLATQADYRRRALDEVEAVLGDSAGPPSGDALRGLKFLDTFIREAGRLYPPVINVPRVLVEEVEFGGYTIPAGTPVRLALAAGHRLPQVFTHPEVFDPDRFALPREEDRRTPYGLVTFGGGPRICIGINFAQLEVRALAAHVLRTYDLAAVPDQPLVHAGHWNATVPHGIHLRAAARA